MDSSPQSIALMRHTATGIVDTSFGSAGIVVTPYEHKEVRANEVLVQDAAKYPPARHPRHTAKFGFFSGIWTTARSIHLSAPTE